MNRVVEQLFRRGLKQQSLWRHDERVLLAISGGVDSMVLLSLMQNLPDKLKPKQIAVAHFNHQLRSASLNEAKALADYCETNGLPFYQGVWDNPVVVNGIEASARQARYDFLFRTAKEQGYDVLLTAHHGDDQVETMLIKMIRGSFLRNLMGIRTVSEREGIRLVRPLLRFSKEEIREWALEKQLVFWEDESNASDDYLRNRLRHHIVPKIAQEAPNYIEKWQSLSTQLTLANDLIEEAILVNFNNCLEFDEEKCPNLIVSRLKSYSEAQQYFILSKFFQEQLINQGVALNQRQFDKVIKDLKVEGQQVWQLSDGWQIEKNYDFLKVSNKITNYPVFEEQTIAVLGDSVTLTTGRLVLEKVQAKLSPNSLVIPERMLPLKVRSFQTGDRFILDKSGRTKKVARYFIDEKVAKENRLDIPIVVNSLGETIWIVEFRKSYLSITSETDKIFYKLTYYKNE